MHRTEWCVSGQQPKDFEQRLLFWIEATPPTAHRGRIHFNHVFGDRLKRQKPHEPQRGEACPILVHALPLGEEERAA
ncbi:MAG: hypothetical protein ACREX9_05465 [Gammaproteobacteria bacterium]